MKPETVNEVPSVGTAEAQPGSGAAHCSARCLDCNHGKEHYTHLTGCVACCYPRERAPQIVDRSVLRMGRWCVPNATAAICPHYAPNDKLCDRRR